MLFGGGEFIPFTKNVRQAKIIAGVNDQNMLFFWLPDCLFRQRIGRDGFVQTPAERADARQVCDTVQERIQIPSRAYGLKSCGDL